MQKKYLMLWQKDYFFYFQETITPSAPVDFDVHDDHHDNFDDLADDPPVSPAREESEVKALHSDIKSCPET